MSASLRKRGGVVPRRRDCCIEPLEGRRLLTAVVFTVNPTLSSLTIGGTIETAGGAVSLVPQATGSLTTEYTGTIDADVEPTSIQFSNTSSVAAENNGTWEPGTTAGNYGAMVTLASNSVPLAIRGLVASGSSGALPISANSDFSATSQSLAIIAGELDYTLGTTTTESLVGLTASNATLETSSYSVANGQATLYLPFSVTYTTSVVTTGDTQLTLSGQIVATATAPVFPGSISGNVRAASPMQNETVYIDTNNVGSFQKGDPSTTTDASGNYTLQGLGAGTYVVRQILPAGFKQASPSNNYGDHVTLTAGENYTTANFGAAALPGTISGTIHAAALLPNVTVYLDLNNNGKLDSGEYKTTTNAFGSYVFTGVKPGAYVARQILPAGYMQVTPSSGYGVHITLAAGHSIVGADFNDALIGVTTGSISGTVFSDDNGNGQIDNGEIGLSGWELYIDRNNSHTLLPADPKAFTDTNGDFTFSGVATGTYIIRTIQQPAWIQTYPLTEFGEHVSLFAGESITDVLFGEISDG